MKAEIKTEMDGRIQHLAVAWLEGTATPAEVEELWEWVKQSEAHYRQLVGLQKEWIRVGREVRYDVDKGFEALKVRLADLSSARRKRLRLRVVGWAAAVMLLLAGGGLWWMQQGVAVQVGSGEESQIVPGSNKAVLVLGTNERVELDEGTADLILTTGGTGFSPKDCTPEATLEVIERQAPGIPEAMRAYSLQFTGRAMLSRAVAGIRGKTLIVNLPGSPKAVSETLEYIFPQLAHGVEILTGAASDCARTEPAREGGQDCDNTKV